MWKLLTFIFNLRSKHKEPYRYPKVFKIVKDEEFFRALDRYNDSIIMDRYIESIKNRKDKHV